ncbi:MAG: hypothetical protein IPN43_11340 [Chitinophagaceae bacterium]|nr:hypothetical protein [Chitinophagaceae bacterium]
MKIFTLILSFFLLYLSCLPCSDSTECNIKAPAAISATDNHQQHRHDAEACTPFCTCSCCAASAFYTSFSKAQVNKVMPSSEKFPLYNVVFTTEANNSIWQPPKIS